MRKQKPSAVPDNEAATSASAPALQIIILGSGGGPSEDNVTGLLIRSTAKKWAKGSVLAVDAGVHLGSITRILDPIQQLPGAVEHAINGSAAQYSEKNNPFSDLKMPHESPASNAAFITRDLITTYLITHPHLDHISGFVVNTASYDRNTSKKKIAALTSTIEAIKAHIFNNVIWPNMSDENNGLGFVSYLRLGEFNSLGPKINSKKGYIDICEGLSVRSLQVSHGRCQFFEKHEIPDIPIHHSSPIKPQSQPVERWYTYDSTAYFIKDTKTGREVLIFGDVEPDSVSLNPRLGRVWDEAAPKIVAGHLPAIVIECSYDDSQSDQMLFGHLTPRHLIAELRALAIKVNQQKAHDQIFTPGTASPRKRKLPWRNAKGEAEQEGSAAPEDAESSSISPQGGLKGLIVFIIHIKDSLKDEVVRTDLIERQLRRGEETERMGCQFIISQCGQDLFV